uniref:uncharacterized protein LOC122583237 n=1 Tax=Erigeron canadensis TaxID=72917 RepID=UPI001CB9625E|nr:uncharacterized protein LOC122583237 [Erigeron canadensis]
MTRGEKKDDVMMIKKKKKVKKKKMVWGTWEELILGGAVIRHGTDDWDVISSELQTRTLFPFHFTPQYSPSYRVLLHWSPAEACKARYEDLQKRYTGCKYWYNELRERRVAELKRELEKSQESIGFLISKLESLKAEKRNGDQIDYDSSQTESPPQTFPKTMGVKIKTTLKQGLKHEIDLSAVNFTQELDTNAPPKSQNPSVGSFQDTEVKLEVPESADTTIEVSNDKGGMIKKRRGKRKRKDGSWDVKEGIVESDNLGSSRQNETSTSGCGRTALSSSADLQNREPCKGPGSDDLVGIFNSVTENQFALVFRRRLDSQKRARYRKTIRQHMDLDTIKSRIANCCIKSSQELFRDLLLIANNALVFYSKRTREYKSALTLRGIVTEKYRQLCSDSSSSSGKRLSSILCFSSMSSPPVRPRSIRARAPCKPPKIVVKIPTGDPIVRPHGYLKLSSHSDSITSNHNDTERSKNSNVGRTKELNSDFTTMSNIDFTSKSNVGCTKKSNADFSNASEPRNVKKGLPRPRRVGGGGRGGKQPPAPRNSANRKRVHHK